MPRPNLINREISWLSFNDRVLQEAADPSVPLIERLKFVGIFSANLEEFFRVRVATLQRMVDAGLLCTLNSDDPPMFGTDLTGEYRLLAGQGFSWEELWRLNQEFWKDKKTRLHQEFIFASTGKKLDWQTDDYYVEQLAGSDIQTNPPATNDAVQRINKTYTRTVDKLPPKPILDEIAQKVDQTKLEATLMKEGIDKFADPQHALLKLIREKRGALAGAK